MSEGQPEPLVFGPAERPCLGWLHHPTTPRRDVGLVICKPFGYEAICAHRSLRHFADAAAAIGVPAFRFDYDGTGDSAGDDRDPERWAAWVASTHAAIDELRRLTGVKRVCLLGVRLGATIAATAASVRVDVSGLIAIVPVVSGRQWLREMNALEIAMGFAGPPAGLELRDGELESVGFIITADTKRAIQSADLLAMTQSPAPAVFLVERDDMAQSPKWAERLAALGAAVDRRALPGYAKMMLDPHEAEVPEPMIEAVRGWLGAHGAPAAVPAARIDAAEQRAVPVAPGVVEVARYLDETHTLFGVVSQPAGGRPTRAIVLLNAGGISHIGPSRLYVDLARRWAARGYLVLRFDQAGIGDSAPYPGERENVIYSRSALRGIEDAVRFIGESYGISEHQALGLCSGAYHALKATVANIPFSTIAVVNPLVFFWKPGMSLAYPPYQVAGESARYKSAFLSAQKWKRVFTGKASIRDFAHVAARRVGQLGATIVRNVARSAGRPLPDDLGAELETIAALGVGLRFVFSTGDPGEDLLRLQGGWSVPRLMRQQRLRIRRIAGPNHAFTPAWTRSALTEVLEDELAIR
jgi:alpha-beta hydrolase superfamily lysophospholipase